MEDKKKKSLPLRGVQRTLKERINSDVLGSYTGQPLYDDDEPVQDSDDL